MVELRLRRSYPDHHDEETRDAFWRVECDGVYVGSIVLHQGRSDEPPVWRWAMHLHAGRHGNGLPGRGGDAATHEQAMADFRRAFERCLAHIGAAGWAYHLAHMAELRARAGAPRRY